MKYNHSIRLYITVICTCLLYNSTIAQEWQWSVEVDHVVSTETNDHPVAYLWIPPGCKRVRGVVVGQHNMIEEGILENVAFRKTMARLGFAEIWITPALNITFDFNKAAGDHFNYMMQLLANESGYTELALAPIVPIGHSALASYPWNFAAWNPGRTVAAISIHGDAPLTKLTGSGRPNPDWGNRNIDGVPCLFVMGEFEWWEDRIQPAFNYINKHPSSTISLLADAGHGHFDYSAELVEYLAMFIEKSAQQRLPASMPIQQGVVLKPVNPTNGWLMDRWRKDSLPSAKASPFNKYKGNRLQASWCFDKEMAQKTGKLYATARGKRNQSIGFIQHGKIVPASGGHAQFIIPFTPLEDGTSFHLKAFFADTSKVIPVKSHAKTKLAIDRICGPVKKINDTTFQLSFNRLGFNNPKRSNEIWLLASNKGDATYKSTVQQLVMRFPIRNTKGSLQHINFPTINDTRQGIQYLQLSATSAAGLPVQYYIKEGPAIIEGNAIKFTPIPPNSKFPVKVTVVAWQYGRASEPAIQSAIPVFQTFYIQQNKHWSH